MFRIDRSGLIGEVLSALRSSSVLLSGSPGIGKSWIASEVARRVQKDRHLLVLAAENYPVSTQDDLRNALGFKNDVLSVLAGFGNGALLIIDGLDSLRTEASQRVFRTLIRFVAEQVPTCGILASIRTFDLQQSDELQNLFRSHNFVSIQVRPLTTSELFQAVTQEPQLGELLTEVASPVRELLTNPYMLKLARQLIREGVAREEILRTESEIELLTKYWNRRIEVRSDENARKALLWTIVIRMVEDRMMSISGATLHEFGDGKDVGAIYRSLKSDEILHEGVTGRISFEHAILFDYAAARLLFDELNVSTTLSADPAKAIFLRPSLSYFFQYVWVKSISDFWKIAFRLFDPKNQLGERASIIPAVTIFESTRNIRQLEPLLNSTEPAALRGVHNILRAIQTFNAFTPRRRQLWLDFIETLSNNPSAIYINEFLTALVAAFQTPGVSDKQRSQIGRISRNILSWTWSYANSLSQERAQSLSGAVTARALPVAMALFDSMPEDSRRILATFFARLDDPRADSHEAFWLVREIRSIAHADPESAYRIVFELFNHVENRKDTTRLGNSSILSLRSTRRQDFSTAIYNVQQFFPEFFKQSPRWALRAALDAVNVEVRRSHVAKSETRSAEQFTFEYLGSNAVYIADYSEIWDQGHVTDQSLNLLTNVLLNVLNPSDPKEMIHDHVQMLFDEVAKRNRLAVVWKRLLEVPKRDYRSVLDYLFPLLTNPVFLAAPEVIAACGSTLEDLYRLDVLTPNQRIAVEESILAIPEAKIIRRYERPETLRNRLISRIPRESIATEAGRKVIDALTEQGATIVNKPYVRTTFQQRSITDEDWLKDQGAKMDDPEVQSLLATYAPLRSFETRYVNEIPKLEDCLAIEDVINQVEKLLSDDKLDKIVSAQAAGVLAGVLEQIVRNSELPQSSSLFVTAKRLLLALSRHSSPERDPDSVDRFDKPSWGTPLARIEAAQGLMRLVWNWGVDQELERAIFQLARDPVPAVRFQIAASVNAFYKHDQNKYWDLIDEIIGTEKTLGVFSGVLSQLTQVAFTHPDHVVARLGTVIEKGYTREDNEFVLGPLASILAGLAAFRGTESAKGQIETFIADPLKHDAVLQKIIFYIGSQILEARETSIAAEVRQRATDISIAIVDGLNRCLDKILNAITFNREHYATILHLSDSIVLRLYIGLDVDAGLRTEGPGIADNERMAYFEQCVPILEALLSSRTDGQPHVASATAFNLMKVFNATLAYDPELVVRLAAKACRAAARFGYEYESLAITETVNLVERIIADHHELLRKTDVAAAITEILDAFVHAGWPAAVQLVMRLDTALR